MRIVIDLDGVICPTRAPDESYADLEPLPHAAERIRDLRAKGHYIIINTARHMATCDGNMGKLMKKIAGPTLRWLDEHGIEYDEIYFGKPNADVYIDDRAIRFLDWGLITDRRLERSVRGR